jgi:hypothetical protein
LADGAKWMLPGLRQRGAPQRVVDAHAELVLDEPEPTPVLGFDETRLPAVTWVRATARSRVWRDTIKVVPSPVRCSCVDRAATYAEVTPRHQRIAQGLGKVDLAVM